MEERYPEKFNPVLSKVDQTISCHLLTSHRTNVPRNTVGSQAAVGVSIFQESSFWREHTWGC